MAPVILRNHSSVNSPLRGFVYFHVSLLEKVRVAAIKKILSPKFTYHHYGGRREK